MIKRKPLIEHPATRDVVRAFLADQIYEIRQRQKKCGSNDIDTFLKLEGAIDQMLLIWWPLLHEKAEG